MAQTFSFPRFGFFLDPAAFDAQHFAVSLDLDRNFFAFAADHPPHDAVANARKAGDRMAVHFQNPVARTQAGLLGRRVFFNVADDGGGIGFADGPSDAPDQHGEGQGQRKAEQRSGKGHDDFVERGNGREIVGAVAVLALDGFHGRHLRKRHITAGGNGSQTKIHPVNFRFPDRFAEPDAEAVNDQPAPTCGQIVAQLVDDNEQVEQQHDFQTDEQNLQYLHNIQLTRTGRVLTLPP